MPIQPAVPWQPDLAAVNGNYTSTVQNVLPRADGYGPWKSLNVFAAPLAAGNDQYTKVLLHFEGADGSTTITDDNFGGSAHTWTAVGNAQIDTAQKALGFSSLLCDGTGDSVSMPDHADITLTGKIFRIKARVRPAVDGSQIYIGGQAADPIAVGTRVWTLTRLVNNHVQAVLGGSAAQLALEGTTSVVAGAWYDIEFVGDGATGYLLVNGVLEASGAISFTPIDSAEPLVIGAGGSVTTNTWNGWIDEVQIDVGIARHTAAYTTEAKPSDVAANSVCRGTFTARNSDGTVTIFAAVTGTVNGADIMRILQLRSVGGDTLDWMDVSGSAYSALPNAYHCQFTQFQNLVIAVQPNIAPQVFTLGSSTTFSNLAGSPPQAAYVATVGRVAVLSGLTSTPFKVQWSGIDSVNASTSWTDGTSFAGSQTLPDGGVVRGSAGGEYGVIFQDNVIRRMVLQYGTTPLVQFEKVTEDMGLLAPYSIIKSGTQILFLAQQGFHSMGPTGVPAPIGKEKFDRFFFNSYDSSQLQLILGASDPEAQRVYWAFPASGAGENFNRIICYDRVLDRASLCISVSGQFISSIAAPGLTLEDLDDISASIDALTFSLDDVALTALPKIAVFNSLGELCFFSGTPLEATIDGAEQRLDGRRMRVRGFWPQTDAASVFGSIGARETPSGTISYSSEQAITAQGKIFANVSTRFARGRVRIPAGTTWNHFTGLEPDAVAEGRR